MAAQKCISVDISGDNYKTATFPCSEENTNDNSTIATDAIAPDDTVYVKYMQEMDRMHIYAINMGTYVTYTFGMIANIALLLFLIKSKRYRSPIFMLITSLCLCDVGTCLGAIVRSAVIVPVLVGPTWTCRTSVWIANYFYSCSVFHLVFFSILRFYQLVFPLTARANITADLVAKVCLFFWVVTAGLVVLVYYRTVSFTYQGETYTACIIAADYKTNFLIIVTVYMLLPDFLIAGFHLAKHCFVTKQATKVMTEQTQKQQRQTTDARAVSIVIIVFWITSVPVLVHTYIHSLFTYPIQEYHLILSVIFINVLLYGNSLVNPFIYVFCAGTIRHDIMVMLKLRN